MRHRFIDFPTRNTSSSISEKTESNIGDHFRWKSIKQFLYISHAFASTTYSFDLFSKLLLVHAHLFEYIIYAILIGVSYMFMDFFIKQYTRRLDTCKALNPLMRGVSFGILLQTAIWTLLHASNLADAVRFVMVSLSRSPAWTKCYNISNVTCLSSQELILNCRNAMVTDFSNTSAHLSYARQFSSYDRNSLSMRLFVIAIVWICNFFVATITDSALLKLFKFSFLFGLFSTAFILIFLMFSTKYTTKAFYDIMNIKDGFNAMFTSSISRLLHSEFRSVKNIYIVGLLCFLGFTLSLPLSIFTIKRRSGILYGLNVCTLYLGGFKVAIVMWIYGVQRFATDIQFCLGFKPTRFWMFLWAMLPVFILVVLIYKAIEIAHIEDPRSQITALVWTLITLFIVVIFNAKIIAKYILKNNLAGVFKSDPKYGPPELDDRKNRRNFNELYHSRQCKHECLILDEKYDCNHLPLMFKDHLASEPSSASSLTNIYDAGPSKKRTSSVIDVSILHMN
ncbi:uncharacterized protein LOC123880327 isoform X2 [Maniola jurtina]|uniref:uncharacterized protein LOC123880327 isoform X2 n=1 Tax=Maniola jurtina TaxID=191418 RepID=UPI001E68AF1D|nr:uncharacterized protein LOC123880327 isoform X2 [Maniola jurtina]